MADIPGMVVTGVNAFENDEVNIHLMPQGADPTPSARPEQRARGRAWLRLDRMRTPGRISMVVIDGETGSPATRSGPNLHCPEASSRIRLPSRRRRLLSEEEAASLQFEVEEHPPALDRQALKDILAAQKEEERRVLGYHGTKDVWCKLPFPGCGVVLTWMQTIDPTYQGRGVGKMLVKWGIGHGKSQGKGLYLSGTPAVRPLYNRFGLEEVGFIEVWGFPQYSFVLPSKAAGLVYNHRAFAHSSKRVSLVPVISYLLPPRTMLHSMSFMSQVEPRSIIQSLLP
ncbi:hypothetical protein GE09DRAFT_640937 [Coniochaeta sp. 2T2.1]|nr:hypothetical protein GE09DRAFT_640937 [Coniochaeta sp. 2T2.1]